MLYKVIYRQRFAKFSLPPLLSYFLYISVITGAEPNLQNPQPNFGYIHKYIYTYIIIVPINDIIYYYARAQSTPPLKNRLYFFRARIAYIIILYIYKYCDRREPPTFAHARPTHHASIIICVDVGNSSKTRM